MQSQGVACLAASFPLKTFLRSCQLPGSEPDSAEPSTLPPSTNVPAAALVTAKPLPPLFFWGE